MSINQTLLREIGSSLEKYDCSLAGVEQVLKPSFPLGRRPSPWYAFQKRRLGSITSISAIMEPHGKRHLFEHVSQLARIETGMRKLVPRHRDHVAHALLGFLLGIYINEKILGEHDAPSVDPFQWEIASLFHDIGYPIEMAYRSVIQPYYEILNIPSHDLYPLPNRFCELSGGRNSLDLIQTQITRWNLDLDVSKEYEKMSRPQAVNHGVIGALTMLRRIDDLYTEQNPGRGHAPNVVGGIDWNESCFDEDIIPSCSAIFLHSLDKTCFKRSKIGLINAPLPYLLKMTDCLQEWDRPGKAGSLLPSDLFDIEVREGRLILTALIPESVKVKMQSEIEGCLENPFVVIK